MLRRAHRLLLLPLVEIVTVGGPFCTFKLLTGRYLMGSPRYAVLGYALLALGALDVVLNAVNFVALAVGKSERPLPVCTLTGLFRLARKSDPAFAELGTSLDVLLSFTLVATMVWSGSIPQLGPTFARVWSACTVLNVLGAGTGRVASALDKLTHERDART